MKRFPMMTRLVMGLALACLPTWLIADQSKQAAKPAPVRSHICPIIRVNDDSHWPAHDQSLALLLLQSRAVRINDTTLCSLSLQSIQRKPLPSKSVS